MENEPIGSCETAAENLRAPRRAKLRARSGAGIKFAFYIHLAAYVAVNLLLVCINLITTPLLWWCLWPIAGWGYALLIHAMVAFSIPDLFGLRQRIYQQELQRQLKK